MALNIISRDREQLPSSPAEATQTAQFCDLNVDRYFEAFNRHDFAAVVDLFAPQGMLLPPFEDVIQGQAAIAAYLQQEAAEMQAHPRKAVVEAENDVETIIRVEGTVQALVFRVNVRWTFIVAAYDRMNHDHMNYGRVNHGRINSVEVELLASPQELLKLRRD